MADAEVLIPAVLDYLENMERSTRHLLHKRRRCEENLKLNRAAFLHSTVLLDDIEKKYAEECKLLDQEQSALTQSGSILCIKRLLEPYLSTAERITLLPRLSAMIKAWADDLSHINYFDVERQLELLLKDRDQ